MLCRRQTAYNLLLLMKSSHRWNPAVHDVFMSVLGYIRQYITRHDIKSIAVYSHLSNKQTTAACFYYYIKIGILLMLTEAVLNDFWTNLTLFIGHQSTVFFLQELFVFPFLWTFVLTMIFALLHSSSWLVSLLICMTETMFCFYLSIAVMIPCT